MSAVVGGSAAAAAAAADVSLIARSNVSEWRARIDGAIFTAARRLT